MKKGNLIGQTFGKLTVISETESRGKTRVYVCSCSCGNSTIVQQGNLKNGHTKSCGCFLIQSRYDKGNDVYQPEYTNWRKMKERCLNPKSDKYHYYGGRGITVCDRWANSFKNFYEDMGQKPSPKHSVERVKGNLGYSKENCVWATHREQMGNVSTNRWMEHEGRKMIFSDWAREFGVHPSSLRDALKNRTFSEVVVFYTNKKRINGL
jgi:hypothetical protein